VAMNRVEVITSVERRRRWSMAEKARLVAAMEEPDAVVTEKVSLLPSAPKFRANPQLRSLTRIQSVDSRSKPTDPMGAPNEEGADLHSQRQGRIERRG
jgi:transposase-like protein